MRKLFGFGTPKQLAAFGRLLFVQINCFLLLPEAMARRISSMRILICQALPPPWSDRHELV
jgi:hypothetical protein